MYPVIINSMSDYEKISGMGFFPIYDWQRFEIDFQLRLSIQNQLFGKTELGHGDVVKANQKFYEYAWFISETKICENCQHPLHYYSAKYISHILSRGSSPEIAHDPRNFNLLCPDCHSQWETGNQSKMIIRKANKRVINLLTLDYY